MLLMMTNFWASGAPDPSSWERPKSKNAELLNLKEIHSKIPYPLYCRKQGIEGKVIFYVKVGSDGSYQEHLAVKSAHQEFTGACEDYLSLLKFNPALDENNLPTESWVAVCFKFELTI